MPFVRKDAVVRTSSSQDVQAQRTALKSGNAQQRWQAARELSGDDVENVLLAAVPSESDGRVREAMFSRLVELNSDGAIDGLCSYIRSDEAELRTAALDALRSSPKAVASKLQALLNDQDPDIRLLSCELARSLPASVAEGFLCDLLLKEEHVNVCAAAIEVLSEVGTPDCSSSLNACAERFPQEDFLQFSISAAKRMIGGQAPIIS
jgi:hypothetical protein